MLTNIKHSYHHKDGELAELIINKSFDTGVITIFLRNDKKTLINVEFKNAQDARKLIKLLADSPFIFSEHNK